MVAVPVRDANFHANAHSRAAGSVVTAACHELKSRLRTPTSASVVDAR
jgi:hypothetical protein